MDSIEVERRLALEKSIESMSEEENSFKYLPQPQRHEDNRLDRLILLKAFKQVIDPIINHHIHPKDKSPVLEVGCATGFFSRHLAPNWLQKRLISFDINTPALQRMKYDGYAGSIVQGSVYNLPFADNSLGAVVGYSSFDSFLFLDQAVSEVFRVLKTGGKVIWFQDLVTELYQFEKNPTHEEKLDTVERYHQILVNTVRKSNFNILEGEDV
ncbi:MAG: class I SAM-dependent methyltransferase, partial [Candidatus Daviesbacteria bacterium]|nr:class I SAM-dependent methyltransferase [Candidatus Daviesbacteria bacterium]